VARAVETAQHLPFRTFGLQNSSARRQPIPASLRGCAS
jgi:hypothetical protein